jgi:hypothetical protein
MTAQHTFRMVDGEQAKAREPEKPRLVLIRWDRLHLLPRREPLIEGVIDIGTMSAIVGSSGSYKTGIVIDWGGHIALGMDWRGHRVRRGTVLYLAVEGGYGIGERLDAWRQYHGVGADGEFYVIPEPIDLAHNDADTRLLLQRISSHGHVDFLVVDTTSRALAGGDENSSKDMGALVRHCDLIRSATGAHICSLHHLGKDQSRGARGHSLLKAALDTELVATKSGRVGSLEITKQRDGPDGMRWGFGIDVINVGDGKQSYVVIPADTPPASNANPWTRGLAVFRDAVLAALLAHGQEHRPAGDGPIVKACLVAEVRVEHNRLYVHSGEGDRAEAERKAWQRALKAARDSHLIGAESRLGQDLVWLLS